MNLINVFSWVENDKKKNVGSITKGPYVIKLQVSDSLSKTRAWYKTEIDLKDLKPGKYTIHIRTKTGTIDDHGELYDILFKNIEKSQIVENKKYTIIRNDNNRFRIEIHVENV